MFERQKLLLALLAANGGWLDKLDFQKLLFLYTKTCEQEPSYEFVPFKKGCYSFTAVADKAKLTAKGFLAASDDWGLTGTGCTIARIAGEVSAKISLFSERRKYLRGESLVAHTYRLHPYWATRSQIAEKVLKNDTATLMAIDKARPVRAGAVLFSIGYERRSLEGYLNTLLRAGVSILCDVRKNPISRKYGFSKKTLSQVCSELDIRYEHLPQLGIDSSERQELNGLADYLVLLNKYDQTVLVNESCALNKIADWVRDGESVALTCYERQPEYCHRTRVAKAVGKLLRASAVVL